MSPSDNHVLASSRKVSGQGMTKVFVITGCAGFIGAEASLQLLEQGHKVIGIDGLIENLYSNESKIRRLRILQTYEGFEFHESNLLTAKLEPLISGADSVLHFAAMAGLPKSWEDPELYFENNVKATSRLVEAMKVAGKPFLVHASTSSVYGGNAVGDETLPLNPISPYGESKLEAETVVNSYSTESGHGATILRFFSVFGPRQRPDMAYSKFCDAILRKQTIKINGDGSQTRSNTFVKDAARAALLATEKKINGAVFNIAGSESISLLDALSVLADELGESPMLEFGPKAPGDQKETGGTTARAKELLGWQPIISVRDGLRLQAQVARADFEVTSL